MKSLFKFFFLFFFLLTSNLKAEVFYIDIDKIINLSKPGIVINEKIESLEKLNKGKILEIKNDLLKREEDLVKQKNILNKEEFNNKLSKLKSDIDLFNKENQKQITDQKNKSIKYKTDLLKLIEPILLEYVSENNIKFLLQKKYIIIGHNDLNKTEEIINLVNQKIDISKFND